MEIDNVRREDSGTYMCTASNNVGTMSADEIDLKVLCKSLSRSIQKNCIDVKNCDLHHISVSSLFYTFAVMRKI